MVKLTLITAIIVICSLGAYFSTASQKTYYKIPKIDAGELYEVKETVDGDTFIIKIGTSEVKVRMLGIDTPETLDPRKPVQCFGREASDKTKELLMGHKVKIKTDKSQGITDKFGRVLAYVDRDDGLFMNGYLLEQGYAHEYTYGMPYEKQKDFKELEKQAQKAKNGLWGDICIKK